MQSGAPYGLAGPTASGKTAVAQWLAEHLSAEILSADSMLVYRGLDIGTAKPSAAERARVRYWGLDLAGPSDPFSVAVWLRAAHTALRASRTAARSLIVTGGTGLYFKCLMEGLADLPPANPAVRERGEAILAQAGIAGLQAALRALDPAWLARLRDPANPRRLLRALELAEAGSPPPEPTWRAETAAPRLVALEWPRDALHARIAARVRELYAAGLLDETRALLAAGWADAATARQAIGYAEAIAVLAGRCTLAEAQDRTAARTRQLAKRQLTWLRRQTPVRWIRLEENEPIGKIGERVLKAWKEIGPLPVADLDER